MSLRRSPIREEKKRQATKGSFKKGHIQPHVESEMELRQTALQAPPTVTTEELEEQGYTHDLVYKNKVGTPCTMTYIMAEELCKRLANGETLKRICKDDHMPGETTVRSWALSHVWFRDKYARAMALRVEKMAEEIVEISDDGTNDWIEYQDFRGRTKIGPDTDHIRRSELRVQTRKWIMSKLAPKKWGDKVEHLGPDGGPIKFEHAVQVVLPDNGRHIMDVTPTDD